MRSSGICDFLVSNEIEEQRGFFLQQSCLVSRYLPNLKYCLSLFFPFPYFLSSVFSFSVCLFFFFYFSCIYGIFNKAMTTVLSIYWLDYWHLLEKEISFLSKHREAALFWLEAYARAKGSPTAQLIVWLFCSCFCKMFQFKPCVVKVFGNISHFGVSDLTSSWRRKEVCSFSGAFLY